MRGVHRRTGAALVAATLLTLLVASTASADVAGQVTTPSGGPLQSASVRVTDATGALVTTRSTDALGRYTVPSSSFSGHPPPFTLTASFSDSCRPSDQRTRQAVTGGVADGAAVGFNLDVLEFCGSTFVSSSLPASTGFADVAGGQVVMPRSGRAYIDAPLPSGAVGVALSLDDGTPAGGLVPGSSRQLQVVGPAAAYAGGLTVSYTVLGTAVRYRLGTLVVQPSTRAAAPAGSFDLVNIVDISGSMSSADPTFRRRDAVSLVLDLSQTGDRIGAIGFDSVADTISPLTTIRGAVTIRRLRAQARRGIVNRGGTNYDAAFEAAYQQLSSASGRERPKAAIFLTDGGHGGTYRNTHLRFAANGTGAPWPICVVRLGSSFSADDVARLRRIARETGGQYVAAPSNARLVDLYFRCRGRTAGERTRGQARTSLRPGQRRVFSQRIPARQAEATFLVAWERGRVNVLLRRPGGPTYSAARNPRSVTYRAGARYAFFRVARPRAGRWLLGVSSRQNPGAITLLASTRPPQPVIRLGGTPLSPAPGDAAVMCGDVKATIVGSDGPDLLVGTPRRDVIQAGPGDDRVSGLGGNDLICLGAGADRGLGGGGNDRVWGHDVDLSPALVDQNRGRFLPDEGNVILGGPGIDVLSGAAGNDTIIGGPARDAVIAGPGDDRMRGDAGNDTLQGGAGDDVADGGPGNDRLVGDEGNDVLRGQAGNDRLNGMDGDDVMVGGTGRDIAFGGNGADRIAGNAGNDRLVGDLFSNPPVGHGPDVIIGGPGDDSIIGGAGDDFVNAGLGADEITGDEGNDTIITGGLFDPDDDDPRSRRGRDQATGGLGDDVIRAGNGPDRLVGNDGADDISGGPGPDRIQGGTGDDQLSGQTGNDSLLGQDGNDRLAGGGGNDLVAGGAGSDVLLGGSGRDRLLGESSNVGSGDDTLFGGSGDDLLISGFFSDQFFGGSGDDVLRLRFPPVGIPVPQSHRLDGGPGNDRCAVSSVVELRVRCELR